MATIFTLEAMHAKHGDALLLHYGPEDAPRLVMIDGGPAGVKTRLVERLVELRDVREDGDDPLRVEMLMVSHIDDDHVRGVQDLLQDLEDARKDQESPLLRIGTLWHNSFEDLLAGPEGAGVSVAGAGADGAPAGPPAQRQAIDEASAVAAAAMDGMPAGGDALLEQRPGMLVLASVKQGREVRRLARALKLPLNKGFRGLVRRRAPVVTHELEGGLRLHVIGPSEDRLDALKKEWDEQVAKLKPSELAAKLAEFADESVFNLSSIVVVAELRAGGAARRMLLTGDARGDDVLEGLADAGMMKNGRASFDVLKVPHHGSDRNVTEDFFRKVQGDTYVISADGKHGNPDVPMLEMLVEARGADAYTIVLTNPVPAATKFLRKRLADGANFRVMIRDEAKSSVRVNLGEALGGR